MDPIINEKLSKLITSEYCELCDVKICNNKATETAHLSGRRHRENLDWFWKNEKSTIKNNTKKLFCKACKQMIESKEEFFKHNGTELHQRNADCYCEVCSIYTPTKNHMWQHLKGKQHKENLKEKGCSPIDGKYSPFGSSFLTEELEKLMLVDICKICHIEILNIKKCVTHYTSESHEKAVEKRLQGQISQKNSKIDEFSTIADLSSKQQQKENINLFEKENVNNNLENAIRLENSNSNNISCSETEQFNCKSSRKFGAQLDLNNQNPNESHLKNLALYCFTCSLLMPSKEHLRDHLKSETHQKQLETSGIPAELLSKSKQEDVDQPKLKRSRLAPRFLKQKIQKLENQQREAEKNEKLMEPDLNSQISKSLAESEPKSLNINNNNCDNAINKTEIAEASIAINATKQANSENLKNKVFNELEKLVQKLYYSKEVPYNVGLDYLKKINKEVDEIIIKNNEEEEQKQAFSIKLDQAACSIEQFIENGFNFKGFIEDEIAKYPVNFEKPIINVTDNILENNATSSSNDQINPEIKASKNKKKSKKSTNDKNIPDLLKDIISKKQNCNENMDELKLLSEIEVLLKQLENIEEVPLLENILKCLQDSNQKLDEIDLKKLKDDQQKMEIKIIEEKLEADEEVEIAKINVNVEENNVADYNIIVNKAIEPIKSKKLVYSKEELLALNPYGNLRNYHREKPNIYSYYYRYYRQSDFDKFMNFVEVYLQGSTEHYLNKEF